ncbi:MAG TPA: FecR domain-containing protein [Rhizomicrobium sp.]|nr:FecR domain-containing protein [Rhizomicrobium sp.]
MSAPDQTSAQSGGAADAEAQAALWLQRRQFWDWSPSDQAELDAWIGQSTAHEVAFIRLMAGYSRTERLVALRAPHVERSVLGRLFHIAAAVIVIAVVGGGALFFSEPKETVYTTPVGGRQTIMLADGSRIDLNTDSVLRIGSDVRRVTLDRGEAYFQIKHDAARPFIVTAGGHRVVDLGTKFLVRSKADHLNVVLVEGRARVDSGDDSGPRSVMLVPGDEVVATARDITKVRKTTQDLSNQLGWRRGVIVFQHTTLADAAAEFNRYNPNKIVIGDDAVAALKIGGTFPSEDPESFAEIAQYLLHLRIERRAGAIVLTK